MKKLKTVSALWVRALSFLMSARELGAIQLSRAKELGEPERAHNREHSASFYLLLGFSTELLLKSAYLLHGGTKPAAAFGHDLRKIFDSTRELGWAPYPARLEWLVNAQQIAHKRFYHRYDTAPIEQEVPDIEEAVQVLWDLAKRLEENFPIVWSE